MLLKINRTKFKMMTLKKEERKKKDKNDNRINRQKEKRGYLRALR